MKAFILAAGFGKRMGDLTRDLPKPLLPVNGRALLDYTLFQLHRWKCSEAVINVHYLPDAIVNHLKSFRGFPVHVSREEKILGTAGGLRNALQYFRDEQAVVMINPDTLFFSHAWDRPEIPVKAFQGDTSACLYLAEKPAHSKERGWDFAPSGNDTDRAAPACDAQDTQPIRFVESGGRYFYNGYSVVNPASIEALEPGKFEEFGPVWVRQAEAGTLLGKVYRGWTMDAGTREPYEDLRNSDPVPDEYREDWEAFLRLWKN